MTAFFILFFFKKDIDKSSLLWYNYYSKGEDPKRER